LCALHKTPQKRDCASKRANNNDAANQTSINQWLAPLIERSIFHHSFKFVPFLNIEHYIGAASVARKKAIRARARKTFAAHTAPERQQ
jgi:hypothetical protein